ncbi:MAG: SusC/RagA family TonB-linked outer membrane protein [Bacteroidales bacterium]|nr:SusC/RagA family TonB-linked outer membrane protein [Candidatus Liminaster caballi]
MTKKGALALCLLMMCCFQAMAQQITNVHGVVEDEFGPLMSATVCEVDANGRVISSTLTDMNGNFSMKIMNPKDQLRIQYVGLNPVTLKIDKTTYKVMMESAQTLSEVTVTQVKRVEGSGMHIPEREVSFAKQTIQMSEFEGLGITTIDEALQGRIAGLDIISLSGNLGSGSTMRLRGASSLSSLTNENPLIVVDGNVWEVDLSNFDVASSNEEKFAELLNINTEDIASINVLKDAAATAIWGSQGGNGVIELTTKRGVKGKPKVTYSLKLTNTYQPEGMKLLSGDDYTMMLKEAYFNPRQDDNASNIPEISYDPNFSEYEQYNNNTDWRKAVTQWGLRQNHYVTISGGGDRATFRVSGGFDNETGSVICQELSRFSTRANLDYNISKRIRVSTNFAMTYTQNHRNSDNLIQIAQKKMPNMSIFEQDPVTGKNTNRYYNMLASGPNIGSEIFKDDQRKYINPVASAHLAKNTQTTYNLQPELVINYNLLGLDSDHTRLSWRGQIYMNVFNEYVDTYYPSELVTTDWHSGHNGASKFSSKSVSLTTKHTLTFEPYISNQDHKVTVLGRMEVNSGSSNAQSSAAIGLPSGVQSPDAGGLNSGLSSNYAEWRSMYFTLAAHYALKERYIADISVRADGTTKFGPDRRWGYFPSVSLRWNVIDEPFMEHLKDSWLSMLSVRPSWGRTGHAPNRDYLYTSQYAIGGSYLGQTTMYPVNLKLTNMQWQTVTSWNLGFDFDILNDRIKTTFEIYNSTTSDMLMENYRIASSTGFSSLAYRNCGKMRNNGWEFYVTTNKMVKKGKFFMDMNVNFGNNRNEILEMDETVLKNMNSTFNNENAQTLTRVQVHNPFGAIYGFRSKGVYQYEYETFAALSPEEQAANLAQGKTYPVALDAAGNVIYNEKGEPIRMMFAYTNDGSGRNYTFRGGDAMYEDVNHDGNINSLDIVYLGSSLPKLVGGFGFNFNYGNWRLSTQFTYRVGNKILNLARLHAEAMIGNDNQSQAVNYRWRKEGDVTSIPRAMYGKDTNYNTLVSDRFVEDGTYLRMSYAQLNYALPKEACKKIGLKKVSLYMSANNPLILTKYTGVDPDVSYSGYGAATDWGQTPRARSYTFGVTVDF